MAVPGAGSFPAFREGAAVFRSVARALRRPRVALVLVTGLLAASAGGAALFVRAQRAAAEADLDANRPADARRKLARCLRVWPWGADLHRLAGRAARADGDLPAAEGHLSRALELTGGATGAIQLEFLLLRAQSGELDAVAPVLEDTVARGHPDAALILETMARAYIVQLRYRPAYVCLSRWIEMRPEVARAYQWRGWVTERLNNHQLAAEDYARALERDPGLVSPRLRLAELYLEDKRAPEALPHLERLMELAPENPQVRSRMGICRYLQGDAAEARRLMEGAVAELPDDPLLLVYLARLDVQAERFAKAEEWIAKVLAIDPTDNEARYALVTVYQAQGRTADAARALKEYEEAKARLLRVNALLKDVADRPTATADEFAEIGDFLLLIGRAEVARYWLDRALQQNPDHQRANRCMAAYYEKKGNAAAAAPHKQRLKGP